MKYSPYTNKSRGFTLVETMVAISIMSLSLLGIFTAVQNGLVSSGFAKDQTIAFYLIQETMEYVRNVRDTNGLRSVGEMSAGRSGINWLTGIAFQATDPCYPGKTCIIDSPNMQVTTCSGGFGTCPYLRQDSSTLFFGYNGGWNTTRFRREVQIQSISSNEIIVLVQVSWTSGIFNKSILVKQTLFNVR